MTPDPSRAPRPIRRLLVANRGELVVRIARTCRELGIRCLALVAADQRDTWWAGQTDEQVPLDGSYLDIDVVLAAARASGADAIHPGYGFLAERPDFADAVVAAGLTWVGPPGAVIRAIGDKAGARALARQVGVPPLPGYDGEEQSDATLHREAERVGYPILIKPSAGGGGKGMHTVPSAAELESTLAQARREAQAAFGDDRLVLERCLEMPRHVEVQVLFDAHGAGVHLGERDCSLQRRHQKVIEEAPAPSLGRELRDRLWAAALRMAGAAGYVGAGTLEFLVAGGGSGTPTDEFFFLEMNTRLQVEHPVTELVSGRDLVADQLRVAAGEPLGFTQADVRIEGHAFEARLYAEDPWHGFLPAGGKVVTARWSAMPGTRVDAGVAAGDEISLRYDPLLAKLVVHGRDRAQALAQLGAALESTRVDGLTTNLAFLRWLTRLPDVEAGDARVDTIERRWPEASTDRSWQTPDWAWELAARALAPEPLSGFRLNAPRRLRLRHGHEEQAVEIAEWTGVPAGVPGGMRETGGPLSAEPHENGSHRPATVDGPLQLEEVVRSAGLDITAWVDVDGRSMSFRLAPPPGTEEAERRAGAAREGGASLVAPMPGTVLSVGITTGETVDPQQTLVVIEAMKMEHAVPAPGAGRVVRVAVTPGQVVQRGELLVEIA